MSLTWTQVSIPHNAAYALDRKGRYVAIHSHAHPSHVLSQVVDPIRSHLG
jgi:hypothetical protein